MGEKSSLSNDGGCSGAAIGMRHALIVPGKRMSAAEVVCAGDLLANSGGLLWTGGNAIYGFARFGADRLRSDAEWTVLRKIRNSNESMSFE